MPSIKFKTEELSKKLTQLKSIISQKAAVPITQNVRVFASDAGNGQYSVGVTGADINAQMTLFFASAIADGPIDVLIPFFKLANILSAAQANELEFRVTDKVASVKINKYTAKLGTVDFTNEWPAAFLLPEASLAVLTLDTLKRQIERTRFAASKETGAGFVTTCALVESDGTKVRVVTTDGQRVAIADALEQRGTFKVQVPSTAMDLIMVLEATKENGQVTVYETDAAIHFQTITEALTVSKIHGKFPPYESVIPKEVATTVKVDSESLKVALNLARVMTDSKDPFAMFTFGGGTPLGISAGKSEQQSNEGMLFRNTSEDEVDPIEQNGPQIKLYFNLDLLQPYIERASGAVTFGINGAKQPVLIDDDAKLGPYRYIQVPASGKPAAAAAENKEA